MNKKKTIEIPYEVYNVFQQEDGFDELFRIKLRSGSSEDVAFHEAVEHIQEIFPMFKFFSDARSWKVQKNKAVSKRMVWLKLIKNQRKIKEQTREIKSRKFK